MRIKQRTIREEVKFCGVGLHSGKEVTLSLVPAEADNGIIIRRVDCGSHNEIKLGLESVLPPDKHQGRQTTLSNGNVSVQTIEHLLAVLHVFKITNLIIEIDNFELPALDGSALPYAEALKDIVVEQEGFIAPLIVKAPLEIDNGFSTTAVFPSERLRIDYTLSYGDKNLADQFVSVIIDEETFVRELAPARTFCLKHEADMLLAMGYGKGATAQNTLVFENNEPIDNKLRFRDEAARHKITDLLGDVYILGRPVIGHIITAKTGHNQNYVLTKKMGEVSMSEKNIDINNFDINSIMSVMPHRYPFLLIDRVLELEPGKRVVAIKNVTINEPFFQGHFPNHPIMPGVLIVEAMAQAGGIVTMLKEKNPEEKVAYFMSIDKAKFRAPVKPGDQLRFEIDVIKSKGPIGVCDCKAYVDGKLVCSAEVKFMVVDK